MYRQWKEELLEELHAQAKLAWDALSILWPPRWVTALVQRLFWDPLRPSAAQTSVGTSGPACDQGTPTVAEGKLLLGFPGVAIS